MMRRALDAERERARAAEAKARQSSKSTFCDDEVDTRTDAMKARTGSESKVGDGEVDTCEDVRVDQTNAPSNDRADVRIDYAGISINDREDVDVMPASASIPARRGIALHVLGSGSKGNAAIVETPDNAILIDCGLSKKDFLARCDAVGFDPTRISAILITHEHNDHVNGLGVTVRGLAKMGVHPVLYVTRASHDASTAIRALDDMLEMRPLVAGEEYTIAGMLTQVFATSHDAAASVGFGFSWEDRAANALEPCRTSATNEHADSLGYVTDTGTLSPLALEVLSNRRLLAIESNHDAHMLEIGPYPSYLKRRIAGDHGHLGNAQAADMLETLLSDRLEQIIGMHLSETNNLPDLPLDALGSTVARNDHPARVQVAAQWKPVTIR